MKAKTQRNLKRTAVLTAYPGWMIREYRDGWLDAAQINGIGLSPGFKTWQEAIQWIKAETGGQV